jgi:hypothetical protein
MSNSLYASLPAQHFMRSAQDLLSDSQYARLSTGHLAGCTQDLSGNLLYAKIISLYARASAEDLFDYTQDFLSTSPYAREVSLHAHRLLNFILLPAFLISSSVLSVSIRGCLNSFLPFGVFVSFGGYSPLFISPPPRLHRCRFLFIRFHSSYTCFSHPLFIFPIVFIVVILPYLLHPRNP